MSLQSLLNQLMGASNNAGTFDQAKSSLTNLASGLPGGLAGGAAAGGLTALLIGNKKARKFAGKAATVGGAALLGGLAYSAFKNWKQTSNSQPNTGTVSSLLNKTSFESAAVLNNNFQLTLIKAMVAAAKADSQIDETEQQKIFEAVDKANLAPDIKGKVFDLLRNTPTLIEIASETNTLEQKTEVYLISCFAIDLDHPSEREHLNNLEQALQLPYGLAQHLQQQATLNAA